MEETAQNKNGHTKALWLQRAANALSYSRMIAAPLLFAHIAKGDHRSWKTTGVVGLLALSDGLDGRLARKAAAIDSSIASEHGAWLDQMADKALTHGMLGGLALHSLRTEKPVQGAVLALNQAVQFARDAWVTQIRKKAAAHNISTKAQSLGKIKTSVLLGSLATLASPTAKHRHGEIIGIAGVTAGSGLALASGISLTHNLSQEILHAQQSKEPADTPALTMDSISLARNVLDDTSQEL